MHRGPSLPERRLSINADKTYKSRYEEDFDECEKLGRGGYGAVYKVQNKLDGLFYALKKIQFKNSSQYLLEKVVREVKTLALLHHPNIVRYHTAWLENVDYMSPDLRPDNPKRLREIEEDDDENEDGHEHEDCDEGNETSMSECIDEADCSDDDSMEQFNQVFKFEEMDKSHIGPIFPGRTASNPLKITQQNIPVPHHAKRHIPSKRPAVAMMNVTTLFIAMQLYSTTLSQWLDTRPQVDTDLNIQIFRQICKGLQYIHARGVIHRDLKPGNIFLSYNQDAAYSRELVVCLGDFGLAIHNGTPPGPSPAHSPTFLSPLSPPSLSSSDGIAASPVTPPSYATSFPLPVPSLTDSLGSSQSSGPTLGRSWEAKKHTSAVGTLTYSSPEQRKGVYNEKTDIYSLGIIFFELFYASRTKMEKARVLADLRNRILPHTFLQKYPAESAFILWLMSPKPEERPSVDEILAHHLLVDEFMTIQRKDVLDYENKVQEQKEVILQQKEYILSLERKLADLCSVQDFSTSRESSSRDSPQNCMQIA